MSACEQLAVGGNGREKKPFARSGEPARGLVRSKVWSHLFDCVCVVILALRDVGAQISFHKRQRDSGAYFPLLLLLKSCFVKPRSRLQVFKSVRDAT